MPIVRGKKSRASAKEENIQSYYTGVGLGLDTSPVIGLGSKKAPKQPLEKTNEVPSPDIIDKGVNEMLASCFTEIRNKIQSKKRRMEQFVTNALLSSNAKLARCSTQDDSERNELRESIPTRPKANGNDAISKILDDGKNSVGTLQELMKNHQNLGLERALLSEVNSFHNRIESFVKVIDEQEIKKRKTVFKMQQELQNEIAAMEKNLVKNEMKIMR